jgi:peptide/nickel transport system substrate-binding protein
VPASPHLGDGTFEQRGWTRAVPALVALLLTVLTAGCSGGDGGAAAVPTLAGDPDAGLEGVRAPSDTAGGTLRVVTSAVDSLDPQRSYSPGVWNLMRLYTRTLVTYSTQPGHTDQLVPDLATDGGTTPDGGLTWTFTLRPGVRFETGAPVTSKDVKYGIERSFASDVVVGGPTHVVDLLDDPNDQYAGPYTDGTRDKLGLRSVETPDDATITFHLRAARPDFPYVLALPSSSPVPQAQDTGADYGRDPVSSGPYAVTSVDATEVVLDRNPQWDRATDPVRSALPDRVVVRTGLSALERDQALLAGSADVDVSGSGITQPTVARVDAVEGLRGRVDDTTSGAVRLLALPTDVAPFDNADCRRAVAAAVDRAAVQDQLGGATAAVRRSVLWPRAVPGAPDDPDPTADPAAAKSALAACGRPDGFSTKLAVPDATASTLVGQAVVDQLAAVGITVELEALPVADFYAKDVGDPDNVRANGYGLVLATWTADFPAPGAFLAPLVDGRSIRSPGNTDFARLDDAGINGLVDAARTAADPAAARDAWAQVAQAAQDTAAYVPLAEDRLFLLAGQRLHNATVSRAYHGYDLATLGVG